jgi:hypothetical protein
MSPEIRRIYRASSVEEMNFVLSQIADRLDQLEGFRGKGNFLVAPSSEAQATDSTDLARYDQVISYADAASAAAASGIFGGVIVTVSANTIRCYAQDDGVTILHGMGDLI